MIKMKAIIPVAGAGKRLRPLTYTQPKPLIPVAGKPIIAFIIDELVDAGIDEFIFIIGYMGEKITTFLEAHYPHIKKSFVFQESRQGLGHAIYLAKEELDGESEIFIALGDTIFEVDVKQMLANKVSTIAIKKVEDPREFGVVETNEEGYVTNAIEKPKIPKSNLAIVGLYKINNVPLLLHSLELIISENKRNIGEFQLTDAIMQMIKAGEKFTTIKTEQWFDCGRKEILLETNELLLSKSGCNISNIDFPNTIIISPVFIGEHCEIKNCIIGPHVTIGNYCKLSDVIVKKSIIGEYAQLDEVLLHESVIGNDTAIRGIQQSLNLGDNTQIDFSV